AAVSFAEWLAITYGGEGPEVAVLCPQGVGTAMAADINRSTVGPDGMLPAGAVAPSALEGIEEERLLILAPPKGADYIKQKGRDPERWIAGMERWQERLKGPA